MSRVVNIAAFEGGSLRLLSPGEKSREVVLALPVSRLLMRVIRVPDENLDDPESYALPVLQAMNPFPDEELTVSCETVRTVESGTVVIAAALPEGASDDIGEELDRNKLSVTRIDALEFGEIRSLWKELAVEGCRKMVLICGPDGFTVMVFDDGDPCSIRSVSPESDVKRELMLCLLEAEDFCGVRNLAEIVVVDRTGGGAGTAQWLDGLSGFAPVRTVEVADGNDALRGIAARTEEPGSLNALPASWADVLGETRFKRKLGRFVIAAVGLWALLLSAMIAVPMVYKSMANGEKERCKRHSRQYHAVKSVKEKYELVQRYRDHSLGALEIMKAVNDALPAEGVEFSSWNYKRGEGVRVSGEADRPEEVFALKEALSSLRLSDEAAEDDDSGPALFTGGVALTGPSARGSKQRFDLDCRFNVEEKE